MPYPTPSLNCLHLGFALLLLKLMNYLILMTQYPMVHLDHPAEQQQHHPDWHNVYNRVDLRLTTHDAGNSVTEKDRLLAKAIAQLPGLAKITG